MFLIQNNEHPLVQNLCWLIYSPILPLNTIYNFAQTLHGGGGEVSVQLCKEYLFNWKNMLNVKEIKKWIIVYGLTLRFSALCFEEATWSCASWEIFKFYGIDETLHQH